LANTLTLSALGAGVALALAFIIALGARRTAGGIGMTAASIGYAAPGAVMALGGLMAMGVALDAGLVGGLGAMAAVAMLIWIYAARFAAAGVGPIAAGLNAATPNLIAAARTLGADRARRAITIEAPIAAPALLAAALMLFVEILKELPATLILRPFDFDTLAVVAHSYAADDRLNAAALPALLIFAAGLFPVMLLTRGIARARAGAR
jgi:iron(III) transport system permease protein